MQPDAASTTGPSTACCRSRSRPDGTPPRTGAGSSAVSSAATPSRSTRCSRHCPADRPRPGLGGELAMGRPPAGRRGGHDRAGQRRRGGDAHQARRTDVRRGPARPPRATASRCPQLGGGAARPAGRRGAATAARPPRRAVDARPPRREVAMSRSSLAERFTAYVGVPPMQYLGRWRLQLAARMLTLRRRQRRSGGLGGRVPVGSGVQPRVQARGGRGAGSVATEPTVAPSRVDDDRYGQSEPQTSGSR